MRGTFHPTWGSLCVQSRLPSRFHERQGARKELTVSNVCRLVSSFATPALGSTVPISRQSPVLAFAVGTALGILLCDELAEGMVRAAAGGSYRALLVHLGGGVRDCDSISRYKDAMKMVRREG